MIYRKDLNRKIYLPIIKMYEDFDVKIPNDLKDVFKAVRKIIGNPTDSFKISIDMKKLNFCDLILNIDVVFNPLRTGEKAYYEKDIIYYSNISIGELLSYKDTIDIPIRIDDIHINIDKLISVISHEIRHVYDLYTCLEDSDMKSFTGSRNYGILKNSEENKDFKYFLYLVYLSLEHELIARNTMIWEMFMNCNCSKEELFNLYKNSNINESLNMLSTFRYDNLIRIPDILSKVNNFIFYFKGNDCNNMEDVKLFFDNWKKYFNEKSEIYQKEAYIVLDDLWNLINENMWRIKKKKTRNIRDILLDIHNKYIFPKN